MVSWGRRWEREKGGGGRGIHTIIELFGGVIMMNIGRNAADGPMEVITAVFDTPHVIVSVKHQGDFIAKAVSEVRPLGVIIPSTRGGRV